MKMFKSYQKNVYCHVKYIICLIIGGKGPGDIQAIIKDDVSST